MIGWAIETFIATTLLMLLVLALRNPVRRAFGPGVAYALWALPLLRMVLPPLPATMRPSAQPMLAIVPEDIVISLGEPVAMLPVEPASGLGWPVWAAVLWLVGVIAFLGYHIIAHSRFCARLRRQARIVTELAAGRVTMIESDTAHGPLAFGIWRKYVAFPADFAERYDDLERDLALAHELGHHARGDLLANWAALVMLGLHWFNPVAWRAFRAFRADQEMACDALVLGGRHPALRHAYGRAIVKSAHGGAVSAACHLHTINEVKGRLRMLTRHRKPSAWQRGGGVIAIGSLALAGLGFTASGTQAAERVKAHVAERTGLDIDAISLPPIPPLPPLPSVAPTAPAIPVVDAPMPPQMPDQPQVPVVPEPPLPPEPPVPAENGEQGDRHVQVYRFSEHGVDGNVEVRSPTAAERRAIAQARVDARRARGEAERALATMPEIISRSCGGDGPVQETQMRAGRQRIILCTDRVTRQVESAERARTDAERAARRAEVSARVGRTQARWSIDLARRAIERDRNLDEGKRREALAGLDKALAGLNDEAN
ncbi:M56 family metallopeptidase [Sphingomonas baiyangensis]|uniref:Peptidase M56 domain-containing protein n=1 Tax=Sphingomonas baiyangensis TaxID=2572576 RepID=A0A4U1L2L7_9SPHN|nr:M56 family metallopeptidase [Sphingomonas baiyangensis]TKD50724.1 hypothetical protein FBR43_08045 [Sphingomonas baiyangensis]